MSEDAPHPVAFGLAFVGCFTTERRRARGTGIDVYRTGATLADWRHLGRVEGITNPSFLVGDPVRKVLTTVQGDGDVVTAYAAEPDGRLRPLGSAGTGGGNGVHQALDPS